MMIENEFYSSDPNRVIVLFIVIINDSPFIHIHT